MVGSGGCIVGGKGLVQSNFILNCNFWFFWEVLAVVEVAGKLRFLNKYGKLDTFQPGEWVEAFGVTV